MNESDRPAAVPTKQIENDMTIVTEWRFAPGAETGWHRHELDYTVVPLTTGELTIDSDQGQAKSALKHGDAYFRKAGVEHNVVNTNAFEFVFVEIEYKDLA